ncbi:MAG: hypothetical protein LBG80_07065 [Bacteroidales bacterium]|jgi:hypothetical protein|nr:hypothetical protein [Bacteroidales bacterium]
MKTKKIFLVLMVLYTIQFIFAQEIEAFDENKYENYIQRFHDGDDGILINRIDNRELNEDMTLEKLFVNKISDKKIYYIGAEYKGNGIFWIYTNEKKEIILETTIRYGPKIIWHGENVAEIIIPTSSPFTHSYYYDFEDNKISTRYDFPIYYDIENKIILVWGNIDFELYDIKTNEIMKIYYSRRIYGLDAFWPYIQYYIKKDNAHIVLYYKDWYKNIEGEIILEIIDKINGA